MTDRIPLDHLTSDQYDQLCNQLEAFRAVARGYCPACGRGDAAPTVDDWQRERRRAETAETALAHLQATSEAAGRLLTRTADERDTLQAVVDRGRALADQWVKAGPPPLGTPLARWWDKRLVELLAALDEPTPAEAQEAEEQPGLA
jgi:hypothetical protein